MSHRLPVQEGPRFWTLALLTLRKTLLFVFEGSLHLAASGYNSVLVRQLFAVSARPFVGDFTSSADGRSGAGVHLFSSTGLPTLEEQLPFQVAFAKVKR